jgi:tRNA(Ile)-lysidine synthase
MRSHPPALVTLARRTIVDEALFGRGARVLAAVSGGPDSMALLHVLAHLRRAIGHELVAHGVDHGLRAEAGAELDRAEALARDLEIPFGRTRTRVAPGGNLQARARAARLVALRAEAARVGASCIATAHHADDRAETVLLRLLRGASPQGLAVLPPRRGDLVRPFLRARRRDILAHLERHRVAFSLDPSNQDPRFLRVRVRSELLPLLESLSAGIVGHLNALADELGARSGQAGDPLEQAFLPPLPRATRLALAALASTRSTTARVRLPHGLVARFEPSTPKSR